MTTLSNPQLRQRHVRSVERVDVPEAPPIDCFYVYPTVSSQLGPNASEAIEPEEDAIAESQASRFSQVCNVYAPIYPQLTIPAINTPGAATPEDSAKAYVGVVSAFLEYLALYNKGRGFELIGHSQGSAMLEQLIHEQIDSKPALRKQLVGAVILFVFFAFLSKGTTTSGALVMCIVALALYTPVMYLTDRWVYNRKLRQQGGGAATLKPRR